MNDRTRLTIPDLAKKKATGERLVMVAVGEALTGNIAEEATNAFKAYAEDVRNSTFPDEEHSYKMKPEEAEKFASMRKLTGIH